MVCGRHVRFTGVLNILAKFGICPSEVWSRHVDKVSETADNPTVAAVKIGSGCESQSSLLKRVFGAIGVRAGMLWVCPKVLRISSAKCFWDKIMVPAIMSRSISHPKYPFVAGEIRHNCVDRF